MQYAQKRRINPKIYIYCNGEVAEPVYFQEFKNYLKSNTIKISYKQFKALAPWELIKKVSNQRDLLNKQGKFYEKDGDQCWCVFDIDQYWKENQKEFEKAIKLAKQNNINFAWSNECFELWYLLHFQPLQSAIARKDYDSKLKTNFKKLDGKDYTKNSNVFMRLVQKQDNAIKNAKKIYKKDRVQENPSTSVFILVEEMKKR